KSAAWHARTRARAAGRPRHEQEAGACIQADAGIRPSRRAGSIRHGPRDIGGVGCAKAIPMNPFVRILIWIVVGPYWALPALIIGAMLAIGVGIWWLVILGWGDLPFWCVIAAAAVTGGLTLHMIIELSILTRR